MISQQMYKQGNITIPLFQRGFVWTQKQASALIESFLMGLPVPSIFFYIERWKLDSLEALLSNVRQADRLHGAERSEQHGKAFDVGKIHRRLEYR